MQQQFFGHPESPLFGVYHPPRGGDAISRAVVICPPTGQEFIRCHWTLRMMATQLARKGIHTFRFDYHGVGDSAGRAEQVPSIEAWTRNVEQAIEQLRKLSGVKNVMLIGLRLGGLLAAKVATRRKDVNSVVLWEPVINGRDYLDALRKMHAQMLDLWVCKMKTPDDEDFEEILGSKYQRSLMKELEGEAFDVGQIPQPQLILKSPLDTEHYSHPEPSLQKLVTTDRDGAWNDLRELETALLRPKATNTIVSTANEMFRRLDCFGVLGSQTSTGAL
jgi:pimeloyl-ACP methyl ester carboxylesterase